MSTNPELLVDTIVSVVRGAYEWFGFECSIVGDTLIVNEGRVGKRARPLILADDGVDGGWYFEGDVVTLFGTDTKVDIVLDKTTDRLCLMIRDDDDVYDADNFDIMITLMRFDCGYWHAAKPEYQRMYNEENGT